MPESIKGVSPSTSSALPVMLTTMPMMYDLIAVPSGALNSSICAEAAGAAPSAASNGRAATAATGAAAWGVALVMLAMSSPMRSWPALSLASLATCAASSNTLFAAVLSPFCMCDWAMSARAPTSPALSSQDRNKVRASSAAVIVSCTRWSKNVISPIVCKVEAKSWESSAFRANLTAPCALRRVTSKSHFKLFPPLTSLSSGDCSLLAYKRSR
mmetsp:Transcript_62254/g.190169  ORF Transcript_62254/g.190169 Transcript_62254/m.190169 type:complete len:214 (-) Transcript_62254:547-1188(-)